MIIPDYIKLGQRMKQLKITQFDLARQLGYTNRHIGRLLCGETPWRLDMAYKLMEILQVESAAIVEYLPPEKQEVVS